MRLSPVYERTGVLLSTAVRIVLGVLLLWQTWSRIERYESFHQSIGGCQLLPQSWGSFVSVALISLASLAGISMVSGLLLKVGLLLGTLVTFVEAGVQVVILIRNTSVYWPGMLDTIAPVSCATLGRTLLLLSALLLLQGPESSDKTVS
jgi:uncharacterized membrane protein YphA (DoxX/SURF4 family)